MTITVTTNDVGETPPKESHSFPLAAKRSSLKGKRRFSLAANSIYSITGRHRGN